MIAVIPARGGSVEVKRKNIAIVEGKPLLCHIADTIKSMGIRVVVSTDDAEIASVAKVHGYEVHDRGLSDDRTPVAEVASAVILDLGYKGPVVVAQPTCPFVTKETLSRLINRLGEDEAVTLATPNSHLLRRHGNRIMEPANRQFLTDNLWSEVGVRVFGKDVPLDTEPAAQIEVEGREAYDIDTIHDLRAAQSTEYTIEIRVAGNQKIGTGHVRRGIALANELQHHDIRFTVTDDSDGWAVDMIEQANYSVPNSISWPPTDLVILDVLDTTRMEVARFKANGSKVVTIEDRGSGGWDADLVVNALYESLYPAKEVSGPDWIDLRPEFVGLPYYQVTSGKRVLVMFGGTDPSNLGERVAKLLDVTWVRPGDDISVAWEMMNHDVLITSAGRTVYEAAAVGIPTIIIAQNSREATHSHLGNGNLYLGIGSVVTDEQITETVTRLLADKDLRQDLSDTSRKSVDGKGLARIAWRVEGLLRGM